MDEIVYTPQKAAYQRWMEQEGIPIYDGLAVEDVTELPLLHPAERQRRRDGNVRRRDSAGRRAQPRKTYV
jgi:hypothetical protein